MTLESDIVARLKSIPALAPVSPSKGFAIHADTFRQDSKVPVWPAVRYTVVGGTTFPDLCGSGSEDADDVRVQFDVVALTSTERSALWRAVRAAMETFTPPAILQGPATNQYDSETKTYRATGDFVIHGSST
jgi:hypothetical protein